jgi:HEAT repeat protein
MRDAADVVGLICALGSDYEKKGFTLRGRAARYLGELQAESAVAPVGELTTDRVLHARESAVHALGRIGRPEALPVLIAALDDPTVRAVAAASLGDIGDASAVPHLVPVLEDPKFLTRATAIDALLRIDDRSGREAADRQLLAESWLRVSAVLSKHLRRHRRHVREIRKAAYKQLGKHYRRLRAMRRSGDVAGLIRELENPFQVGGVSVRGRAAIYLGRLAAAEAAEPLIRVLADDDEYVRGAAAKALGTVGDVRAVEPLLAALRDPSEFVRAHAIGSLGEIGDPRAVPALLPLLEMNSWMWARAPTLYALSLLDHPETRDVVERHRRATPWYRWSAVNRDVRKHRRLERRRARARPRRRAELP